MRIGIVTPLVGSTPTGNLITAERWAGLLGELGHDVDVRGSWLGEPWDLLIALHARKSRASICAFEHGPIIVMTTGTDVYPDPDPHSLDSLRRADRIVLLQAAALTRLPPDLRPRAVVIEQSASPPATTVAPRPEVYETCLLAHLRPIKDPLIVPRALARLAPTSRVTVTHAGAVLDAELAGHVRQAASREPRYDFVGPVAHAEAMELLGRSRALLLTSHAEGGGNVLCEAVAGHKPILATDIDAARALLGDDHPGLFPVGDDAALAELLRRLESDPGFEEQLQERSRAVAERVQPATEREALRTLLASVTTAA